MSVTERMNNLLAVLAESRESKERKNKWVADQAPKITGYGAYKDRLKLGRRSLHKVGHGANYKEISRRHNTKDIEAVRRLAKIYNT